MPIRPQDHEVSGRLHAAMTGSLGGIASREDLQIAAGVERALAPGSRS
jgi:hypothetical protein